MKTKLKLTSLSVNEAEMHEWDRVIAERFKELNMPRAGVMRALMQAWVEGKVGMDVEMIMKYNEDYKRGNPNFGPNFNNHKK